jgi:glutaredoxin 3
MADVEIYYWPTCPYCQRAMKLLDNKGVKYTGHNMTDREDERQALASRTGGRVSMPQIFINGEHIGGCDDIHALDEQGKLDAMLAA